MSSDTRELGFTGGEPRYWESALVDLIDAVPNGIFRALDYTSLNAVDAFAT